MRILITGSTYAPAFNGQSMFTTNLAEGMARRGHEVWVLLPFPKGKPYLEERNGVHIRAVSALEISFVHSDAYTSIFPEAEVRRFMKDFKADIVHLQDHYPLSVSVMFQARRSKTKLVGTNHFMPENLLPYIPLAPVLKPVLNRIMWEWMKFTYNRLDVAVAPSKTAADIIRKQKMRIPVQAISCGVSLQRFHPDHGIDRKALRAQYGLDPQRTTFLFVGRVDGEKRVDVLIRAIKALKRDDIQLAVTGKGAALPGLKALAQDLKVEDLVRFTGFVPDTDLPGLLNSIDIFAMPSEAELLSIASLEAMATARPILAANSKALPELVTDDVNGYLFKPGSVAEAMRCMASLADHAERWPAMGAASLEKVQPHSLENMLSSYEQLYQQLLEKGSK
jgi:glycosyltransferase involved in cell wall biosynthesis